MNEDNISKTIRNLIESAGAELPIREPDSEEYRRTKAMMLQLTPIERNMIGLTSMFRMMFRMGEKIDPKVQHQMIELGLNHFRLVTILHFFDVIVPEINECLVKIPDLKPRNEFEVEFFELCHGLQLTADQVYAESEKLRKELYYLIRDHLPAPPDDPKPEQSSNEDKKEGGEEPA